MATIGKLFVSNPLLFMVVVLQVSSFFYDAAYGNWKRGVIMFSVGIANGVLLTMEQ